MTATITPDAIDHSDLAEWLLEQEWSEFATSLAEQYARTGRLTERQWSGARRMYVKCEQRAAERAAQRAADEAAGTVTPERTGVDLGDLFAGTPADRLTLRQPGADRSLRIDRPTRGRWSGWYFVRDAETEERIGSQRPGQPYTGRAVEVLVWAVDNRAAAFAEHGHATGHCGICSRTLTDPESVARGIGPICWDRIS
jgi:hypothetical protein